MTSYRHAGTTLRRTSPDVIMAVNGLRHFLCWAKSLGEEEKEWFISRFGEAKDRIGNAINAKQTAWLSTP